MRKDTDFRLTDDEQDTPNDKAESSSQNKSGDNSETDIDDMSGIER